MRGYIKDDVDKIIVHNKKELEEIDTFDRLLFPLKYLEKPEPWITSLKMFLKKQNVWSDELDERVIQPLRDRISSTIDFMIPTIELKRVRYAVVSKIFEQINTKGKRLKGFALMNNRMAPYVILNKLWNNTLKKYSKIKTYDEKFKEGNMSQYILESISLSYTDSKSCRGPDILDMYHDNVDLKGWTPEIFEDMWNKITEYTNRAIEKLENRQNGFGVQSADALPYEPMLPVLASLIQYVSEILNNEGMFIEEKIKKWFWSSVFHQRYSQGVQGRKTSDYNAMINWFKHEEEIPKFIVEFEKEYQRIKFESVTSNRSAIYRGVLCLIMKQGALDPKLSLYDEKKKPDMDHIFPKSKMKEEVKHSILNMTWLTDVTNSGKNNTMPKEYYTGIIKEHYADNESKLRIVLSSHLINDDTYYYLMEDDFEEFLESRRKEILKAIADEIVIDYKTTLQVPTQTDKDDTFGNQVMLMDKMEECKKELFCQVIVQEGLLSKYLEASNENEKQ